MSANFQAKQTALNFSAFEFFEFLHMPYFGSYNVHSVAESWVEAEMSWVEVDGVERRLK